MSVRISCSASAGFRGCSRSLRRVIADEKPTLLVLDGLTTAHALGEPESALKEFVAELQVLSDMSRCTTLVLANMNAQNASRRRALDGRRPPRADARPHSAAHRPRDRESSKFRGGDHFLGRHEMEISNVGVVVRPRTEMLLVAAHRRRSGDAVSPRVDTGIEHLDTMLGGGLLASSATMLLGFSGSGKTLLSLHFLDAGAQKQEAGLYFGFYEPPERLIETGAARRHERRSARTTRRGMTRILWQPALRYSLDALAERLLADVRERSVKRVVIDGIDGFRQGAAFPERTIRFVTALTNELRALDATVLITEETQKIFGPEVEVRVEGLSALVDNIILLEYMDVGSELKRLLSVIKQRGAGHEASVRELCITDKGVELSAGRDERERHPRGASSGSPVIYGGRAGPDAHGTGRRRRVRRSGGPLDGSGRRRPSRAQGRRWRGRVAHPQHAAV